MRHCCLKCHFLLKYTTARGREPWDETDRLFWRPKGHRDDEDFAKIPVENRSAYRVYKVGCYKDEWNSPYAGFTRQPLK